jgi:serine/threonine protein kinase
MRYFMKFKDIFLLLLACAVNSANILLANQVNLINQSSDNLAVKAKLKPDSSIEKMLNKGESLLLTDHKNIISLEFFQDNDASTATVITENFEDDIRKQISSPKSIFDEVKRATFAEGISIKDYSSLEETLKKESAIITYAIKNTDAGYYLEQLDTLSKSELSKTDLSESYELLQKDAPQCSQITKTKEIEISGQIAGGSGGEIYQVCLGQSPSKDCDWVLKKSDITIPYAWTANNEFFNEVGIQANLSPLVAPRSLGGFVCSERKTVYGMQVMQKLDGTLKDYLIENPITNNELVKLMRVIQLLHDENVAHQDLHAGNIMYKKNNGEIKFYIIDFGKSYKYKTSDPEEKSVFKGSLQDPEGMRLGGRRSVMFESDYKDIISHLKKLFAMEIALIMGNEIILPGPSKGESIIKSIKLPSVESLENLTNLSQMRFFCTGQNSRIDECISQGSDPRIMETVKELLQGSFPGDLVAWILEKFPHSWHNFYDLALKKIDSNNSEDRIVALKIFKSLVKFHREEVAEELVRSGKKGSLNIEAIMKIISDKSLLDAFVKNNNTLINYLANSAEAVMSIVADKDIENAIITNIMADPSFVQILVNTAKAAVDSTSLEKINLGWQLLQFIADNQKWEKDYAPMYYAIFKIILDSLTKFPWPLGELEPRFNKILLVLSKLYPLLDNMYQETSSEILSLEKKINDELYGKITNVIWD